jgi:hypothetical protein
MLGYSSVKYATWQLQGNLYERLKFANGSIFWVKVYACSVFSSDGRENISFSVAMSASYGSVADDCQLVAATKRNRRPHQ